MNPRQRVFLVRHGHTGWNESGRYLGKSDIDLDDAGREQAMRLRDWVESAGMDAIVTSPAVRALHTAAIVGAGPGIAPRVDPRLRELDFGVAEGRTLAELRAHDPTVVDRFEADPVIHHFPDGEDPHAAVARMRGAIDDVVALGLPRVLVITHNTALRLLVCHLLGIPLAGYRRCLPVAEHCALTEVSATGGTFALHRFNTPAWGFAATPPIPRSRLPEADKSPEPSR